ncbi:SAG family member [Eimeria mitis]|uniref:SAG family member n=1 Tax=Eimeria mitis TaxID=44415 RepID=U6K6Q7_9EIME|nr:SAG family member [Eimeria mitis]CDJ33654.1 SAG family member [Eimeria mitis]
MVGLKFLSLATATIFLLDTNGANAAGSAADTYTAKRVDCSASMNEARKLVGFAEFTEGQTAEEKLPIDPVSKTAGATGTTYIESVCSALKAVRRDTEFLNSQLPCALDGTYAYAVQEGTDADCEAAVDHWKAALSNFKSLPPQYTEDTELYKDPQNVSFISLFNPKENPKVDCAYFTCPAKENKPKQQSTDVVGGTGDNGEKDPNADEGDGDDEEEPETGEGSETTTDKEVKALLCITTPNALTQGAAPYTQAQWDQITAGLNKNAAHALPISLGFAVAAVGVLLL